MTAQAEYRYDVFISYSHADRAWVWDDLLPRLEGAGLRACIDDRDFELGAPRIKEIERGVLGSRKTLAVLTPAYIQSEWAGLGETLARTLDPAAQRRRLIPVVVQPCEVPFGISALTYANLFDDPSDSQWNRLLKALTLAAVAPSGIWSNDLMGDQSAVIKHGGSHACLLAGPGTGKTYCITRRIEYLITDEGISPYVIVALTFTRAAAAELRDRVQEHLQLPEHQCPRISTLHSFALRQLLRNSDLTSLPQPLRIADDYEERYVIHEELKNLVGCRIRRIRELFNMLSADWQTLNRERHDWEETFPDARFLGAWREHREIYGYTLRSELVYQLKRTLEQRSDFQLDSPLRHLIIDEYQDLNRCDLAVIRAFALRGSELYVAGDDDQSIYGFRHALPEGIRQFGQDFPGAEVLSLAKCRRCPASILDLAQFVAELDPRRFPKKLVPADLSGSGIVKLLGFKDQFEEAKGIGYLCHWLINDCGCTPADILILTRTDTNRSLSNVIRAGLPEDIPVDTVENPLQPLNEVAGRELLCALKLAINPDDDLAWRVWISIRKNNIGPSILASVYDLARQQRGRYSQALKMVSNDETLLPKFGARVAYEVRTLQALVEQIKEQLENELDVVLTEALHLVVHDNGTRQQLLALFDQVKAETDAQNLQDLITGLQVSLGGYEQTAQPDKVRIMTMHQAKGLTARAVILASVEDEFLPGRSQGTPREDDERRLLYVSLTRAREFLFLTHCEKRREQQRRMGSSPGQLKRTLTRFLQDAPVRSEDGMRFVAGLSSG